MSTVAPDVATLQLKRKIMNVKAFLDYYTLLCQSYSPLCVTTMSHVQ